MARENAFVFIDESGDTHIYFFYVLIVCQICLFV